MRFFMPTKVYAQTGCVTAHAKELTLGRHALIVTGRHSSRINGSLDDVTAVLDANNIRYTIFDEVEENPSVETVMKARDAGIGAGADHVIGIGGGSPLDCAKAAALMIANPDKGWQFMYEDTKADALPM
ncbi:MAG: iron-containing alcohol dehydrogenase, partial [Oscillospiraceae bacterium]|nr:iron-containing alcohol dehydrogenase [Oscillospiraceae bacterium]